MDIDIPTGRSPVIHLQPAPIPAEGHALWSSSGRTILSALSPSSNSLVAWVAPKADSSTRAWQDENGVCREDPPARVTNSYDPDKAIYMGGWGSTDPQLHNFYKQTFGIFTSAQAIHQLHTTSLIPGQATASSQGPAAASLEQINSVRRISSLRVLAENYIEELEAIVTDPKLEEAIRLHHLSLLRIFSLSTLLFLPHDGLGNSIVGEELLDWLNSYADGDGWGAVCDSANRLAARMKEWEEDDWDSTISISILRGPEVAQRLLHSLSVSHPEPQIAGFAEILSSALLKLPRSKDVDVFPTSASFLSAHATWRAELRAAISLFCDAKEDSGGWLELEFDVEGVDRAILEDETQRWENTLLRFVRILLGDEETILEVIETEGDGDWKLALGVWGVWVDTTLKRDRYTDEGWLEGGLRSCLKTINETTPVDDGDIPDSVMQAMCDYDITTALVRCNELSLWLATHLTDLLEKVDLVDDDDDEAYELPLRDFFIIQYADMLLMSNPGYWEIGCEYLGGCGSQGLGRIQEILRRVRLGFTTPYQSEQHSNGSNELDDHMTDQPKQGSSVSELLETVTAVLKVAVDRGLEDERREICRLAALRFLDLGLYKEAIAYSIESSSARTLEVVAEALLDIYCVQGSQAYLEAAAYIPASLFKLDHRTQDGQRSNHAPNQDQRRHLPQFHSFLFLDRFAEYLTALKDGRRTPAAETLIGCFAQLLVPETFLAVLLMDTLPLLEDKQEIVFNEKDTYEIIKNVDFVAQASQHEPVVFLKRLCRNEGDATASPSVLTDTLSVLDAIRLAAARNLSRIALL